MHYRDYSKFNQKNSWGTICSEKNQRYPWFLVWTQIKQRCNNPKATGYKWYGGRGIKCLITLEELKFLWFRDKAWKLKIPSIDRKDSNGNYTLENCRFIELSENVSRVNRKTILQYDLEGIFISEYKSIQQAIIYTKQSRYEISKNLQGKTKSINGFIWKYKNI